MKILVTLLFLLPFNVFARTPSMPLEQLEKYSNYIVHGKVTETMKTGDLKGCWKSRNESKLKVTKIIKGDPTDFLTIKFRVWDSASKCTGQPDNIPYVGKRGKYYLSCNKESPVYNIV